MKSYGVAHIRPNSISQNKVAPQATECQTTTRHFLTRGKICKLEFVVNFLTIKLNNCAKRFLSNGAYNRRKSYSDLAIKGERASIIMRFSELMCSCCRVSTMCFFLRHFSANVRLRSPSNAICTHPRTRSVFSVNIS